jgi:DNA primase
VSTPLDWDEVAAGAEGEHTLVFVAAEVLERVADRGDLFADSLELHQRLPSIGEEASKAPGNS